MIDHLDNIKVTPTVSLAGLNTLRVAAGMKPLKAWKESKVKLQTAINKLSKVAANDEGPGAPSPTNKSADAKTTTVERMAKEVIAKTSKAKPAGAAGKYTEGLISIATIAAELDIDPKVARAKLRRAGNVAGSSDSRWMFTKEQAAAAKAILSGDKRKK